LIVSQGEVMRLTILMTAHTVAVFGLLMLAMFGA
jgi:hypothetical protein